MLTGTIHIRWDIVIYSCPTKIVLLLGIHMLQYGQLVKWVFLLNSLFSWFVLYIRWHRSNCNYTNSRITNAVIILSIIRWTDHTYVISMIVSNKSLMLFDVGILDLIPLFNVSPKMYPGSMEVRWSSIPKTRISNISYTCSSILHTSECILSPSMLLWAYWGISWQRWRWWQQL